MAERISYTVAEVAALIGCTRQHIYNLVDRGELRSIRLGRRVMIPAEALDGIRTGDR